MLDVNSGEIAFIVGAEAVVDATGTRAGDPITKAFNAGSAECGGDLVYLCESQVSPELEYVVNTETCAPGLVLNDVDVDGEETELRSCMRVEELFLSAQD